LNQRLKDLEVSSSIIDDVSHKDVDGMKLTEVEPTTSREVQPNVAHSKGGLGSPTTHTSMAPSPAKCVHAELIKGSEMDKVGAARTSTPMEAFLRREREPKRMRSQRYALTRTRWYIVKVDIRVL